jgi:hypothetical protein
MSITPCHGYIVAQKQDQADHADNQRCRMAVVGCMVASLFQVRRMAGLSMDSTQKNLL